MRFIPISKNSGSIDIIKKIHFLIQRYPANNNNDMITIKIPEGGIMDIKIKDNMIPPKKEPMPSIKYTFCGFKMKEAAGNRAPKMIQEGDRVTSEITKIL